MNSQPNVSTPVSEILATIDQVLDDYEASTIDGGRAGHSLDWLILDDTRQPQYLSAAHL